MANYYLYIETNSLDKTGYKSYNNSKVLRLYNKNDNDNIIKYLKKDVEVHIKLLDVLKGFKKENNIDRWIWNSI